MRLAAQMFTVRDYCKTESDIADSLARLKKIGYNAVQLSGLGNYDTANLKKTLDGLGMSVCATHTPLDRLYNDIDKVIAEHKILGVKYVGLGGFECHSIEDCKDFLNKIMPSVEKIYGAGLKFVYHNHAHEFIKYGGESPMQYILANTDAAKFGILADLYWVMEAGCCPLRFIRDNAERLDIVHFKDMRAARGKTNMAEIFEGNMDYKSIYAACLQAGVKWAAVEQDLCDGDPFTSLEISFNNLKTHGLFKE